MNKIVLAFFVLLHVSLSAQFNAVDRLILDMPFNGNANDISGNHNNGIVHGAVLTSNRFGEPNSAYYFQKDSLAAIEIPASPSMDSITVSSGYSISAWINIISWNSGGAPLLAIIERHNIATDGGIDFLAFPFGPYYNGVQGNFRFIKNEWFNVVLTIDPSVDSLFFYVNGSNIGGFPYTIPYDTSNHGPYSIGTSLTGSDEYSDGVIDDVKIYARVLKAEEIDNNYIAVTEVLGNRHNLVIYPNPVCAQINLEWGNTEEGTTYIQLLNALGEVLLEHEELSAKASLDVQSLEPGTYFLQFQNGSNSQYKRIVKQ